MHQFIWCLTYTSERALRTLRGARPLGRPRSRMLSVSEEAAEAILTSWQVTVFGF